MAHKPEEILKLFSKSEELLEMFRKGKAFTEELMYENERLRYRTVQLEAEKMDLSDTLIKEVERLRLENAQMSQKVSDTLMKEVEKLRLENAQMSQKVDFLDGRFKEVEAENKDFAQRYVEVEEQNE